MNLSMSSSYSRSRLTQQPVPLDADCSLTLRFSSSLGRFDPQVQFLLLLIAHSTSGRSSPSQWQTDLIQSLPCLSFGSLFTKGRSHIPSCSFSYCRWQTRPQRSRRRSTLPFLRSLASKNPLAPPLSFTSFSRPLPLSRLGGASSREG